MVERNMKKNCKGTIILTSRGLNSKTGNKLIWKKIRRIFGEEIGEKIILLVIPPSYSDTITNIIVDACGMAGLKKENIKVNDLSVNPDIIYVGEGNATIILDFLNNSKLFDCIKKRMMMENCVYIGASAGAMIAGKDIQIALELESNEALLEEFSALELFDGVAIPHYSRADLNRYLMNTDINTKRYNSIISVGEEQIIVL